jgi:tetratricopeptide (TPR) repeat protein
VSAIGAAAVAKFRTPRPRAPEYVLVADFATDSASRAIGDLLAVSTSRALSSSIVLRAVPDSRVRAARRRLGIAETVALIDTTAQQLAVGDGIRSIVAGTIRSFAGNYAVSLRLVAALSGDVLASSERTSVPADKLTIVLDSLTRDLRAEAGEDLAVIRAQPPLQAITSSSLEAMLLYVAARRASDAQAVEMLRKAIALDTAFSAALWQLTYRGAKAGLVELDERRRLHARAYRHRDRLTEYERRRIDDAYFWSPGGRTPQRAQLMDRLREDVRMYPNADDAAVLAEFYLNRQQYAAADSMYRVALALDSTVAQGRYQFDLTLILENRLAEARQFFDGLPPDFPVRGALERELTYVERHRERLRPMYDSTVKSAGNDSRKLVGALVNRANLNFLDGRLADADRDLHVADSLSMPPGKIPELGQMRAKAMFWIRNRPDEALRLLDSLQSKYPKRWDREVSLLYGLLGRPQSAAAMLAAVDSFPRELFYQGTERHQALGAIRIGEGKFLDGIHELRASRTMTDGPPDANAVIVDPEIGYAFEKANLPDSAIVVYEHYRTSPFTPHLAEYAYRLPWVLEHVADLYARKGDREKARAAYEEFVRLWQNADGDLQQRVTRAKGQLASLSRASR